MTKDRYCRACGAEEGRPHHDPAVSDDGRLTVELDARGRCQPCAEGFAAMAKAKAAPMTVADYAGPDCTAYETPVHGLAVRRAAASEYTLFFAMRGRGALGEIRSEAWLSPAQVRDLRRWLQMREADLIERGELQPEEEPEEQDDPHGIQWLAKRVYNREDQPEEDAAVQLAYAVLQERKR